MVATIQHCPNFKTKTEWSAPLRSAFSISCRAGPAAPTAPGFPPKRSIPAAKRSIPDANRSFPPPNRSFRLGNRSILPAKRSSKAANRSFPAVICPIPTDPCWPRQFSTARTSKPRLNGQLRCAPHFLFRVALARLPPRHPDFPRSARFRRLSAPFPTLTAHFHRLTARFVSVTAPFSRLSDQIRPLIDHFPRSSAPFPSIPDGRDNSALPELQNQD